MFLELENNLSLFDLSIGGVLIWERIRFPIFTTLTKQLVKKQASASADYLAEMLTIRKAELYMKSSLNIGKNPFFAPRCNVLFFSSQRRFLETDSYWWDIYTDPIVESLPIESVSIEEHLRGCHHSPAKTNSLYYCDIIDAITQIGRILNRYDSILSRRDRKNLKEITMAILDIFPVELDIEQLVSRLLHERKIQLPLYKMLLNHLAPRVVVLVTGYGKENFIEACKQNDVTTIELQHGVISPYHVGYSFEGKNRWKECFPDYLFVWGDYWKKAADFPLPRERIVSTGFPYFEMKRSSYRDISPKRRILFISQETIGRALSQFASRFARACNLDYEIVYKLHPRECEGWRKRYPWLQTPRIEIIDGQETSIYELFSKSTIQVGVYSTAIYEGLAFGLETYLVDLPGIAYMSHLIDENIVTRISTVTELLECLSSPEHEIVFDTEYFFKSNSVNNIVSLIAELSNS